MPRPYPDHQQLEVLEDDLKYFPFDRTSVDGRQLDFQPHAQLKMAVSREAQCGCTIPLSITEFSKKYVVSENNVRDYVQHVDHLQLMERKRSALAEEKRAHIHLTQKLTLKVKMKFFWK